MIVTIRYIDCSAMKTAYDCLKSGCDLAEAADGQFICHKEYDNQGNRIEQQELFGRIES